MQSITTTKMNDETVSKTLSKQSKLQQEVIKWVGQNESFVESWKLQQEVIKGFRVGITNDSKPNDHYQ